MSDPVVRAIIVMHGRADDVIHCIKSAERVRYRPVDIIIVDNGAPPDQVERLGGVRIVSTGSNLGFAGGANAGIRAALDDGAEAMWLLNPDARPDPQCLRWMVRAMRRRPQVGIVGCRVLEALGDRIQSEGGRIVWEAGGRSELIGRGTIPSRLRRGPVRSVDFVSGASMLLRRDMINEIGLLDERWFLYFEETEYCVKARRAGWDVVVEPKAEVAHEFAPHNRLPETLIYYFVRNRIHFGLEYTEVPLERIVEDVGGFVTSWRRRIESDLPDRLRRFEQIVEMAFDDAKAGVWGPREGIG